MPPWLDAPLTLKGKTVELISLRQDHIPALQLLSAEKRIWQHYAIDGSIPGVITNSLEQAIAERETGLQFPFAIFHRKQQKTIGSTRYLAIEPAHRKLEIGWTWLHPDYWGTTVNLEAKLLLLTHCFELINAVRVQLKTDVNNIRSKKAIEKLGARMEGVFRNDMIRSNGSLRDSIYFSIVQQDWPLVKANLVELIENKRDTSLEEPAQPV